MIPGVVKLAAIAAVLATAFGAGWWVNGNRWEVKYNKLGAEYAQFVATTKAAGEQARKLTEAKDAENQRAKRAADAARAKTRRDLDSLYAAYRSLRDQRASAGSGVLPSAPAGSASPARACFDRAELDRALARADGVLQSGAEALLRRGDEAIVDLNTAREWAAGRHQ